MAHWIRWDPTRHNLSLGFPTQQDLSQSSRLQRLASLDTANNKDADQTACMRRLVCTFFICKLPNTGFLAYIISNENIASRYYKGRDITNKLANRFIAQISLL